MILIPSDLQRTQVMAALEELSEDEEKLLAFEAKLNEDGKAALGEQGFEISKGMCSWAKGTKKVSEVKFTPSVIEPSFGKCCPFSGHPFYFFTELIRSLLGLSVAGRAHPLKRHRNCDWQDRTFQDKTDNLRLRCNVFPPKHKKVMV